MAGDFVMVQFATPRKPEVLRIATILDVEPIHAFGLCIAAWMWFDEQTEDGRALGATVDMLDAVVCRAGFSNALRDVGWLEVRDGSLSIPNFDRLMGESAKKRAKNTVRQQRSRRNATVTKTSREKRDKSATKEEKRRDVTTTVVTNTVPAAKFAKPSVDDVRSYCSERGNSVDPEAFHAYYTAQGWKLSNGLAMKDWRQAVITWEKRDANRSGTGLARPSGKPGGGGLFQREQASQDQQLGTIQGWLEKRSVDDSVQQAGLRPIDGLPDSDKTHVLTDGDST